MDARNGSASTSPGSKKMTRGHTCGFSHVQDVIAQPPPGELGSHVIPEGHVLRAGAGWTLKSPPGPEVQQQPLFAKWWAIPPILKTTTISGAAIKMMRIMRRIMTPVDIGFSYIMLESIYHFTG
jgi:hypothetical protein